MKKIILLFSFTITNLVFAPFERAPLRAEKPINSILYLRQLLGAKASPLTLCFTYDPSTKRLNENGTFSKSETLALICQHPRYAFALDFKNRRNLLIISEPGEMPLEKLFKEIYESLPS